MENFQAKMFDVFTDLAAFADAMKGEDYEQADRLLHSAREKLDDFVVEMAGILHREARGR